MLSRPSPQDLIAIALAHLQEDVLPNLEGEARLSGLMIARAIGIAQQQLAHGEAAEEELKRIQSLYAETLGADVVAARRRLAGDIRARKFKPGSPEENRLIDALTATVAADMRIVNVKYMAQRQRGKGAESAV